MLSKHLEEGRNQIEMVALDQLVPKDHLVRKIEQAINFEFIYDLVQDKYCLDKGRPSVDPVVLIKMVFIQYLFGIRSMRQTIKEIETNVAYRWFIGYGFTEKIPHFSTFGKNYVRRFQDTDLFEQIFYRILKEAMRKGLVDPSVAFIDSTHVKANANKKKFEKKVARVETRSYQGQLDEEINMDREEHGKKPFPPQNKEEVKEIKVSTTDPESGYYVKDEREKMFAYSFHTASDSRGFILGSLVTGGHVHDSRMLDSLVTSVTKNVEKPKAVAVDAGYKTPYIAKFLMDQNIRPVMPYTRPRRKEGYLKKEEYVYDEHFNHYLCPEGQILSYRTTTRDGYRQYASHPQFCKTCPLLESCTQSQNYTKVIHRHMWQDYIEETEHLRHTNLNRRLYAKRKETIERVFADAKEKHGMRWTTLRGLKKVSMQAMLTLAAMNLKKLANWTWQGPCPA
ncbi:IS1182 family transposase [Priestia endophytica]|uniref:IS1182 family transposase n=1 Tax=Priestia endophytica TaxID=135735 RepID=UPI002281605C|nr:IS1182 family transposase [Priestia endophytica]MCY8235569.1 IS1182 family transposase [Priestia endophytica]